MSNQNKRRNFDGNFKAKVAIEAIQEKLTLSELAAKHNVFPTQIHIDSEHGQAYLVLSKRTRCLHLFDLDLVWC